VESTAYAPCLCCLAASCCAHQFDLGASLPYVIDFTASLLRELPKELMGQHAEWARGVHPEPLADADVSPASGKRSRPVSGGHGKNEAGRVTTARLPTGASRPLWLGDGRDAMKYPGRSKWVPDGVAADGSEGEFGEGRSIWSRTSSFNGSCVAWSGRRKRRDNRSGATAGRQSAAGVICVHRQVQRLGDGV
jgi:hypothetical protein